MVNPLIFRNTIHPAKQKRKRDTSFVIRCIVRVRFFNYLTKFYSPFIKLPPPTCRDYHPQTIWGAAEEAEALPAPGDTLHTLGSAGSRAAGADPHPWSPAGQRPTGCGGRAALLPAWEFSSPEALGNPAMPGRVFPTWRDGHQSRMTAASPGDRSEAGEVSHWQQRPVLQRLSNCCGLREFSASLGHSLELVHAEAGTAASSSAPGAWVCLYTSYG